MPEPNPPARQEMGKAYIGLCLRISISLSLVFLPSRRARSAGLPRVPQADVVEGCLVCLSGCGGRPFLRFYDKMHLTMYRGKWQKGNLEALGLERWADLALTPKYWVNTCGSCSGCPSTTGVPTWRSQNRANEYCARCWWQFLGDGTGHGNTP